MFSADLGVNQVASNPPATDPPFQRVALLLHGDGTNGAQNNTFVDSSSNALTITRSGNVAQGTFSPFSLAEGQWSNYFDGSGDYLDAGSNSAYNFDTGNFTVECWFYRLSVTGRSDFMGSYASPTSGWGISTSLTNSGDVAFYYGNTVIAISSGSVWTANSWNHVAVARNGTSLAIYVNGVSVATATDSTNISSGNSLKIGAAGNATQLVTGYISNVRIVKGTAVYTSNFTPSTSPLTAISGTSLLTCQSNRFVDNSSNNFTITRNGDTKVTAFSPFAPSAAYSASTNGGSGYFDGSGDYLTTPYPNTSLEIESGDFTVEAWIYIPSSTIYKCIYGNWIDTAGGVLFCLYNGGPALLWRPYNTATPLVTGPAVQLNAWNHVAVSRSGNVFTVFTNGVAGTPVTYSTNIGTTAVYRVGVYSNGSGGPWLGYITDVRVIKGTALYTSNFTPPTAPLTAVTNTQLLINCTNAGILDNAGKNDIETVGNAQISTSVKKYGTGSMYFDGTGDYLAVPNSDLSEFGSGDLTIEAWVNFAGYPASVAAGAPMSIIVAKQQNLTSSSSTQILGFRFSVAGTTSSITSLSFVQYSNNTGTSNSVSGSYTFALNQWYHVAVTRSSNNVRLFVNGTQVGSTTTFTITQQNTNIPSTVGGMNFVNYNYYLNGYIDDLRITKGQALYTSNFTPPTQAFPNV